MDSVLASSVDYSLEDGRGLGRETHVVLPYETGKEHTMQERAMTSGCLIRKRHVLCC